jgi:hypothetical protein
MLLPVHKGKLKKKKKKKKKKAVGGDPCEN